MNEKQFTDLLDSVTKELTKKSISSKFTTSKDFENSVRESIQTYLGKSIAIDFDPHPQAFPDIAIQEFGVEVKFTTNDTWRSIANSVLERNRIDTVKKVFIIFGKMGGTPCVKWGEYEKCVMHVRTSHVPRFEVELYPKQSLFELMGTTYDEFRSSSMDEKMRHIRKYARARLEDGERLWWLDDSHTLPMQARLYTKIQDDSEKRRLRAEAILLCPQVFKSSRSRDKYDDVALYLLTAHGVLCHQARDLFTAGSVAHSTRNETGGIYIEKATLQIEKEIIEAADRLSDSVFEEYWGEVVPKSKRIKKWLEKADSFAKDWKPSAVLFKTRR